MEQLLKKLLKQRLKENFFIQDTPTVAQKLLGKLIVLHQNDSVLVGKIVETESYRSDDAASHTFIGKTERNSAMFGPVGHAYVYMNHGLHYGFNVVARDKKFLAGGVLIRAVEPLVGIEIMQKRRNTNTIIKNIHDLTNGPGKFTQAYGINKKYNHHNLLDSCELFIADGDIINAESVGISTRIGISKAKEHLWRFFIKNNPFVSRFKA